MSSKTKLARLSRPSCDRADAANAGGDRSETDNSDAGLSGALLTKDITNRRYRYLHFGSSSVCAAGDAAVRTLCFTNTCRVACLHDTLFG